MAFTDIVRTTNNQNTFSQHITVIWKPLINLTSLFSIYTTNFWSPLTLVVKLGKTAKECLNTKDKMQQRLSHQSL